MYKLDNNVAWTEDLKNAFKHNVTRAKITYIENNETITIDENTGIKELTLEDNRYVPEVGFIGQATAKKLTLTLLDNAQTTNLENKEFTLSIGADYNNQTYYITYGNFIVNEAPQNDSTNGTIKITAYDYMIKFNKIYEDTIEYPTTIGALYTNICQQAGVTRVSPNFTNSTFVVENNQFTGKTLREVLQHICKSAFGWARIGQDNRIYLDNINITSTNNNTEIITMDDYKQNAYKKANEYFGPVDKVTYGDSDIQGQEESVGTGNNEIVINDNYFGYTTAKRQQLIQAGEVLFGLKYMPIFKLDLIGLIYLDCNDFIKIQYTGEDDVLSRVFAHTIKYNGVISDSISTESNSKTEKEYENRNTTAAANTRTEISVDRANQKITSIVSQIGDRSSKTTTITQDIDGIQSQVEELEDYEREFDVYTQAHITEAMKQNIIEIEVRGNQTYENYLFPSETLYPAEDLLPNMEGSELR